MTATETNNSPMEPRWHGRAAVLALMALTAVAMGRLCVNDFTWWDDAETVHHNPWLLPPTLGTVVHYWTMPAYGLYIPVTYTAWAAIASISHMEPDESGIALNPWLFHGLNVCCHLLAVLVIYRILRLLNADVFGSFCGALLFAVHPIQVEAVGWVSGLKDVLSGMLALVALWQYVAFSLSDLRGRASAVRYGIATFIFVLAMLAKPGVMALPLAAMAIDRWIVGRSWGRIVPAISGWIIVALPIAAIARWAQDATNTPTPALWLRPLIACDALSFYLWKLVWPFNLIVDYERNPIVVLREGWCYWDWIVPVGLGTLLIVGARKRPVLLAAGIIFVAGCLPVLGLTPAMFQYFSTTTDHYLYLSVFGPAVALAWLLSVRPSFALRWCALAMALLLIPLTIRQGGFWRNDVALFTHDTRVNPGSYIGLINLGGVYQTRHDSADALAAYRAASRVNPDYAMVWKNLAVVLADEGRFDEAVPCARRCIDLQNKNPTLRTTWPEDNQLLGELLLDIGRPGEAIGYLQVAADLNPSDKHVAKELSDAKKRAATQPAVK